MSTIQEQVSYPLPVIHMNGTGAEGLMAGYENIYDCINKLQAAMEKCIVHGRDYLPPRRTRCRSLSGRMEREIQAQ